MPDRCEHLDADSRRMLFELADRENFQVLFTCVDDADDLRVEIVDHEPTETA